MFKTITEWIQGKPARSSKWASFRKAFLARNRTCAGCGTSVKLEVHHINPYHIRPDLELVEENCIVLCDGGGSCHLSLGHLQDWESWNPTVRKDAKDYLQKVQTRPFYRR